jgi:hypothetical protein
VPRALLAPAGLLCLVACHVGPRFAEFRPAHAPEGVRVEASVASSDAPRGARIEVNGELLEMREQGLLVLGALAEVRAEGREKVPVRHSGGNKRVVLVAFDGIQKARFEGMGRRCELHDGIVPTHAVRDRLRLVSRFPQGLAPELLRRLLEMQGQAEIQRLGP